MTRSNTVIQSLTFAILGVVLGCAMPAAAWSGHNNNYYGNNWHDNNDRTPTCWIKASPNTVYHYGGRVNLSWESTDAEWAEITDLGVVPVDSTAGINVYTSKTYRMTVHNGSRSAECDTFVNVVGEVRSNNTNYYGYNYYPQQSNYVLLTQIPYTGFDFGPVGNAIYWMTLATIAIAGAYLLIYQRGMSALASIPVVHDVIRAGRMQLRVARNLVRTPESTPTVPTQAYVAEETLVATRFGGDSMKVIEGETPRIIITRD